MAYKVNSKCICCRMCDLFCPTGAIHYGGSQFVIEPEKCVECGVCLEYCNMNAIVPEDSPKIQEAAKKHSTASLSCDLCVIGGGGAGLITAVRFAESTGKKVIVIEKAENTGGSAWYAAGMMIPASELGSSMGIPDIREQMKKQVREESAPFGGIDNELIDVTVDAQKDMFDWLCRLDGFGSEFSLKLTPHGNYGLDFTNVASGGRGGLGRYVVIRMRQRIEELGISVITCCEATELLLDDSGAVCGVAAKDSRGDLTVSCKAVMMAAGSFINNKEMMMKVCPGFATARLKMQGHLYPTLTGDGIAMGDRAGAKILWENLNVCLKGPSPMPLYHILQATGEWPENIFVNLDGKRWMNESYVSRLAGTMGGVVIDMTNHLLQQKEAHSLSVFDSKILDNSLSYFLTPENGNDFNKLTAEDLETMKYFIDSNDHTMMKADTLEELASLMGVEPEVFCKTVTEYNAMCKAGVDTAFGKDPKNMKPLETPPYYAVKCYPFCDGAFGGFPITSKMETLKKDGTIFKGLYAGGDITDSRFIPFTRGWDKKTQIMTDLPWAYVSGFLAADSIAEYLLNI